MRALCRMSRARRRCLKKKKREEKKKREGMRVCARGEFFFGGAPLLCALAASRLPRLTSGSLSVGRPSSAAARAMRDLARSSAARRAAAMSSGVSAGAGGGEFAGGGGNGAEGANQLR